MMNSNKPIVDPREAEDLIARIDALEKGLQAESEVRASELNEIRAQKSLDHVRQQTVQPPPVMPQNEGVAPTAPGAVSQLVNALMAGKALPAANEHGAGAHFGVETMPRAPVHPDEAATALPGDAIEMVAREVARVRALRPETRPQIGKKPDRLATHSMPLIRPPGPSADSRKKPDSVAARSDSDKAAQADFSARYQEAFAAKAGPTPAAKPLEEPVMGEREHAKANAAGDAPELGFKSDCAPIEAPASEASAPEVPASEAPSFSTPSQRPTAFNWRQAVFRWAGAIALVAAGLWLSFNLPDFTKARSKPAPVEEVVLDPAPSAQPAGAARKSGVISPSAVSPAVTSPAVVSPAVINPAANSEPAKPDVKADEKPAVNAGAEPMAPPIKAKADERTAREVERKRDAKAAVLATSEKANREKANREKTKRERAERAAPKAIAAAGQSPWPARGESLDFAPAAELRPTAIPSAAPVIQQVRSACNGLSGLAAAQCLSCSEFSLFKRSVCLAEEKERYCQSRRGRAADCPTTAALELMNQR